MELTVPQTWQISVELLIAALVCIAGGAWAARAAYGRVMGAIGELKVKIESIEQRNAQADLKEAELSRRLQITETAQAVQTAQMTTMMQAIDRMDRNVAEMVRIITEGRA
ncbi:hypothetical protein [Microcystis phage Mel-JY33]